MSRDTVLTPEAVDTMIANGDCIVIFQDYVLRLNSWLGKHPGGKLAILHMIGRDATDEITAYHMEHTLRTMRAYRVGVKPPGAWTNRTPPIRGGRFDKPAVLSDTEKTTLLDDELNGHPPVELGSREQSPACSDDSAYVSGRESTLDRAVQRTKAKDTPYTLPLTKELLGHNLPGSQITMNADEWTEWAIRQDRDVDLRQYPSLDADVQEDIADKYRALHRRIENEGLYHCRYIEYGKELMRYTALFLSFLGALRAGWFLVSAAFLGLFWHQIMFTAHDAGHRAITKNFVVDTLIGLFIGDFCAGLSMGWWKSSHNVHHLVTNSPEHDPDIQNVPLFATCPSFVKSLRSSYYDFTFVWDSAADFMVQYQQYTFYPVMCVARFLLYFLSWSHVLSSKSSGLAGSSAWWIRPTEIAFMACYWFLYGYVLVWRTLPTWPIRVAFVFVSHMVTMPLHVQFTLSHWGMSTSELGESESFAQRQLRTTLDVDCPAWLDFIHGGLQFQAIHHLFPRVPRHNLRTVQGMVKEFCAETGVPYSILGFVDGNRQVIGRLRDVGDQVKILLNCQKYMSITGDSGLH